MWEAPAAKGYVQVSKQLIRSIGACTRMLGYLDVLAFLHDTVRPRTYLEVGVFRGDSLRLARADSICVGVDPNPLLEPRGERHCHIEVTTSDAFFAGSRPCELFGYLPIDMVFIDGMHLFEYALRDFANAERLMGPRSLLILHDCMPRDAATASRQPVTGQWTGDVWKLVLCLLDHRPDLEITIIDVEPSGLCLVRGLGPKDRTLLDCYDAIVAQYLPLGFEDWQARLADVLQRTTHGPVARYWAARREAPSEARAADLDRELQAVYESSSWRFSAPIRWVGALLRRFRPPGP